MTDNNNIYLHNDLIQNKEASIARARARQTVGANKAKLTSSSSPVAAIQFANGFQAAIDELALHLAKEFASNATMANQAVKLLAPGYVAPDPPAQTDIDELLETFPTLALLGEPAEWQQKSVTSGTRGLALTPDHVQTLMAQVLANMHEHIDRVIAAELLNMLNDTEKAVAFPAKRDRTKGVKAIRALKEEYAGDDSKQSRTLVSKLQSAVYAPESGQDPCIWIHNLLKTAAEIRASTAEGSYDWQSGKVDKVINIALYERGLGPWVPMAFLIHVLRDDVKELREHGPDARISRGYRGEAVDFTEAAEDGQQPFEVNSTYAEAMISRIHTSMIELKQVEAIQANAAAIDKLVLARAVQANGAATSRTATPPPTKRGGRTSQGARAQRGTRGGRPAETGNHERHDIDCILCPKGKHFIRHCDQFPGWQDMTPALWLQMGTRVSEIKFNNVNETDPIASLDKLAAGKFGTFRDKASSFARAWKSARPTVAPGVPANTVMVTSNIEDCEDYYGEDSEEAEDDYADPWSDLLEDGGGDF